MYAPAELGQLKNRNGLVALMKYQTYKHTLVFTHVHMHATRLISALRKVYLYISTLMYLNMLILKLTGIGMVYEFEKLHNFFNINKERYA